MARNTAHRPVARKSPVKEQLSAELYFFRSLGIVAGNRRSFQRFKMGGMSGKGQYKKTKQQNKIKKFSFY